MRIILCLLCAVFFHAVYGDNPRVCLALAIHDDEAVIGDCLESVKEIIDCVVISDLGSNDQTKSIVENFLKQNGLVGAIVQDEQPIAAAQKITSDLGWDPSQTYLLVLPPDATCKIDTKFSKQDLQKDGYLILEPSEDLSYFHYKPNFLRASVQWSVVEPYVNHRLKTFSWNVNSKETYRSKRMNKKMKERLRELESDPDRLDSILTMAGFYKQLRCYDQAIELYQKCVLQRGNPFEMWLSRYMLGHCLELRGDDKGALHWYLEAYRTAPDRPETLQKIFHQTSPQGDPDIVWVL